MEQIVPYGSIISGFTSVNNTGSGSGNKAPGSTSKSRPAPASQTASVIAPSEFSPAFLFTPLLDTSKVSKIETKHEYSKEISISSQLENNPIATKEIQIVVPPRQDKSRCEDDPKYNDRKTFAGNLIDHVICETQDFFKRIGNFF